MSVKALNIIFMGTPEFAVPVLKSINKSKHNLLAVYTQPPKKKLRGQVITILKHNKWEKDNTNKVKHDVRNEWSTAEK